MKFLVLKKHTLIFAALVIALCTMLSLPFGENSAASVFFGDNLRKVPIYSVQTDEKKVAISFDAAWGADKTEGIINILKEYKVSATFFLVGFWVEDYPEEAKKVAESGFEIGTHSNTHPDMTKLSKQDMTLELNTSIEKIQKATGKTPTLFRAPFGSYNNTLLSVAENLNLVSIQWDVDSLDWKGISAKEICDRITSKVKNGSIILCHNNSKNILNALPLVLERLLQQGYTVCSVGELIYKDNYQIDRAGVQKKI
ncbi:MAG: polysaccharide deacetylase family protein [Clostridia bacterium]|nr:polysaccharide deacetylase family protein [Clostridia bacterium]